MDQPFPSHNDALEKIPCVIYPYANEGCAFAVRALISTIQHKVAEKGRCILGLPTGNTPIMAYKLLVDAYKEGRVSFEKVHIFLLDEYYPIDLDDAASFYTFIQEHLVRHIDLPKDQLHYLDGATPLARLAEHTQQYEKLITDYGGMDLLLLGIGRNGHIGFNEPGAHLNSSTRKVVLNPVTRRDNAKAFNGRVMPYTALSMGLGTMLKSERIILMAWGEEKADIVQAVMEQDVSSSKPASYLQLHPNVLFVLDERSAHKLTRFQAPWRGGPCEWKLPMMKKAIIGLALQLKKPILSLTEQDYLDHGLQDILVFKKDAYQANLDVFYALRDSITGWPGGKASPLPNHPERSTPYPKRVLIFSPHPDDDIISMGGTFIRLVEQGHEVHVAYQTSGNIAVTDDFAYRFLDFTLNFQEAFHLDTHLVHTHLVRSLLKKAMDKREKNAPTFAMDTPEVRRVKELIRRCEARATCRYVGVPDERIHFQHLPFYETGAIHKNPISEADVQQTIALLNAIEPHQIYCAGDLSDPHGTHKICMEIILQALQRIKEAKTSWIKDCWLWLYKGAWQEWDICDIEMAIPMSPDQVRQKRHGIFIHQSQKDIVPFRGKDKREFWQRTEDRNKHTADLYNALGLTHYAAMEAFVRYRF